MKNLSQERVGEIFILSGAILWSLFPIVTILSINSLSPLVSLAWATMFSFFFFAAVAYVRSSWTNIFTKEILPSLLGVALITAILFYILFFWGLKYTSAGNASIIATLEIFFTFMFFNIWRKEFIDKKHVAGAAFMLLSAVIILSPNFSRVQIGDFFILGAAFIAPFGNLLQKKLRTKINSEQILFFRTLIATPVLFLFAHLVGETISLPSAKTWIILMINGIILLGLTKIFWIESIHRMSVTKTISLSSISPIFTLIFAFLILKDAPTLAQITALPPAILGVYLLTRPVAK